MKKLILILGVLASGFSFGGPLDHTIPMQVKGIDSVKMIQDANKLARINLENKIENEKTKIYQEGQSDPEKMLALAKKSKLARWVVPYFQDQLNIQNINKSSSTPTNNLSREQMRQTCTNLGDVAKTAMQTRQRGVSIQDMYKALEGQDEKFRVVTELIINDAFSVKLAENESEAGSIVSEFSNQVFRSCMSN